VRMMLLWTRIVTTSEAQMERSLVLDYKIVRGNGVPGMWSKDLHQYGIIEMRIEGIFISVGYRSGIDDPVFWFSTIAISGGIQRLMQPPTKPIQTMRYSSIGQSNASMASLV